MHPKEKWASYGIWWCIHVYDGVYLSASPSPLLLQLICPPRWGWVPFLQLHLLAQPFSLGLLLQNATAEQEIRSQVLHSERKKIQTPEEPRQKEQDRDKGHVQIIANRILVYQCICVCVRVPKLLCIAMSIWNLAKTNSTWTEDVPSSARLALRSISKLLQPHSTWRFLLQSSWCTRASGQTPVFTESTWKSRTNLPEVKDVANPQSRLLQIRYWGCPFPLKKSPTLTLSPRFLSNGTGLTKQLSVRMPAIHIVENPNWIFHLAEQTVPLFSFDVSSIYTCVDLFVEHRPYNQWYIWHMYLQDKAEFYSTYCLEV